MPTLRSTAIATALCASLCGYGQSWEVFDMGTAGLPSNNVTDVAEDSQGVIWAATSWGLCRYDGSTWTFFQQAGSGLPDNVIRAIAVDSLDRIWVGTQLHGICIYDGATWQTIDQDNSPLPDNEINSLTIDHRGWAWIGTYLGLVCYTGTEWRLYNTSDTTYNGFQLNGNVIQDVEVRPDGLVAVGTLNGGFHYITDTSITVHSSSIDLFPDNTQNEVAFDLVNNERWVATPSQGLLRQGGNWWDGPWFQYTTGNSTLPSNTVTCLDVATSGRVWLGTLLAGLAVRETNGSFTNYTSGNSDLPDNTVQCVLVASDGSIWAGTAYGGLVRLTFNEGVRTVAANRIKLHPNPCVDHLFVEMEGVDRSASWSIMDTGGRTVMKGEFDRNTSIVDIPLEGVGPAIYMLVWSTATGRSVEKFQVLR